MADVPDLIHENSLGDEDDDGDDDGWEECPGGGDQGSCECLCLFCSTSQASPEQVFLHCKAKHSFDILHIQQIYQLDCFSYIKLVNYIRSQKPSPQEFTHLGNLNKQTWLNDEYMMPVLETDPLLQFDLEDLPREFLGNSCMSGTAVKLEDESDLVSAREHRQVLLKLRAADERAKAAEEQLQRAMEDLDLMRTHAQELVLSQSIALPSGEKAISRLRDDEDEMYMDSYGHFGIHQDMLQDRVRTESYRDAIVNNADVFRDKVVLDIGCGTGILSMFAARAGAKLVIGVDMSDIVFQAIDIIRENGLVDRIKILKGRMEDVDLPVTQVDVIISEWMGYFLLFESMLDTVIWSRMRYLAPGGLLLPDHCNISLAALSDQEAHQRNIQYWNDVYGFKMSCMRTAVVKEGSVLVVKPENIITDSYVIKELDLYSCDTKDLEFTSSFSLCVKRDGDVTAFVGYFDTRFSRCPKPVEFSTSPCSTPTHWKQTVFSLEETVPVKQGDVIEGQMICQKKRKDPRSLTVTLICWQKTFSYVLQ